MGLQSLFQQCLGGHHPCICNRADQRADLLFPCISQKQLQPKQRGGLGQFLHCLHHRDQFRSGKKPRRCATPTWKVGGNWTATSMILQETTATAPHPSFKHPPSGWMRRIPVQTAYNWVLAMFRHGRIRVETDMMPAKVPGVAAHLLSLMV